MLFYGGARTTGLEPDLKRFPCAGAYAGDVHGAAAAQFGRHEKAVRAAKRNPVTVQHNPAPTIDINQCECLPRTWRETDRHQGTVAAQE